MTATYCCGGGAVVNCGNAGNEDCGCDAGIGCATAIGIVGATAITTGVCSRTVGVCHATWCVGAGAAIAYVVGGGAWCSTWTGWNLAAGCCGCWC